jgi:3D (Asp-Asp-Asp) domain-containing protein
MKKKSNIRFVFLAVFLGVLWPIFGAPITGFCLCSICCGRQASGINAAGKKPVQGVSIAASRSIPLGSVVKIDGIKNRFIVDDRTAKRFDGRFDIFFNSHQEAKKFGIKNLKVEIEPQNKNRKPLK